MNRQEKLKILKSKKVFDFIVIGGGATGLGCALDASKRGYSVALFEKFDFCNATSSRSTKLIHGGVRYLEKFNFKLVYEALKERDFLIKNAPHVVNKIGFIIPVYSYLQKVYYWIGLKIYDCREQKLKKAYLWTSLIFNLSLLGFFKYFNFFIDSWLDLLGNLGFETQISWTLNVILPVGISFEPI